MRVRLLVYVSSQTGWLNVCSLPVDIVSPIEREIRQLSHGLTSVKDEQEYIVVRERTHRNTAESTNDRVKWWSILQAIVLFSVVAWQVYYLKVSRVQLCTGSLLTLLAVFLRGQAGLLVYGDIWSSCIIYLALSDPCCASAAPRGVRSRGASPSLGIRTSRLPHQLQVEESINQGSSDVHTV